MRELKDYDRRAAAAAERSAETSKWTFVPCMAEPFDCNPRSILI